jgi:oligoribonuclease NrnB/cAMP/cGMP phosphodiesterase (DHH superfamily)
VPTRTIAISHCADVDGIGCVALLRMKYEIKDRDVFLIDYTTEALVAVEKAIKKAKPKNTTLFISDLSSNNDKIPIFLSIIKTIKTGGGKVFWFDHHPWSEEATKKISKECEEIICGERDECATEITARQLKLKGKFVNEFVKICHASDFNLQPKDKRIMSLIKTYAIGIASYNTKPRSVSDKKLKMLAAALTSGKFTNKDIVAEARRFDQISKKRIKVMVKELSLIGDKIAVGFAKSLQSTNACYHITKTSGRDIGIFINLDANRGNVRSIKANINPLASALGGGGHPHASGFSFDPKKYDTSTKKGRLLLLDRIDFEAEKLKL